jgi:preprotein translocase subunit SecF
MNLIAKRKWWYAISLILILPGVVALCLWGLRLGIDFKGGSEDTVSGSVDQAKVLQFATQDGFKDVTFVSAGGGNTIIRFLDPTPDAKHEAHHQTFKTQIGTIGLTEQSFTSIGPSVSSDIARDAILSLLAASVAIVLYVAFAFRNAPQPVSPLSFGVLAIAALLHDSLFVLGVFALLGHFAGVEIDSLFVTAILTVIGFSVHDTIVVFDRIRENLRRERGDFETIVNHSILETLARSINTSLTVLLTLLALLLFGGASIHLFVLALLLGIASGTYSSIFNASPLLVSWHNYKLRHPKKPKAAPVKAKR